MDGTLWCNRTANSHHNVIGRVHALSLPLLSLFSLLSLALRIATTTRCKCRKLVCRTCGLCKCKCHPSSVPAAPRGRPKGNARHTRTTATDRSYCELSSDDDSGGSGDDESNGSDDYHPVHPQPAKRMCKEKHGGAELCKGLGMDKVLAHNVPAQCVIEEYSSFVDLPEESQTRLVTFTQHSVQRVCEI